MKFIVWMEIENNEYKYGTYSDRDKANEIALQVREERNVDVWVEEEPERMSTKWFDTLSDEQIEMLSGDGINRHI